MIEAMSIGARVWLAVGLTLLATGVAVAGGVGLAQWCRWRDRRRWARAGYSPLEGHARRRRLP